MNGGKDSLNGKYGVQLPDCKEAWLYVGDDSKKLLLYFEIYKNKSNVKQKKHDKSIDHDTCYYYASTVFPVSYLVNMGSKHFHIAASDYNEQSRELRLRISLLSTGPVRLEFANEYCKISKKLSTGTRQLLYHFYNRMLEGKCVLIIYRLRFIY